MDDGEVSPDCLQRQVLYTEADIGKPRAEAAAARLGLVNPDAVVLSSRLSRLSHGDDLRECLRGSDLLVCAADRQVYSMVNDAALAERVPWLRGTDDGLVASMFLHVPGQTACYECERQASTTRVAVSGDASSPCSAPASGLIGSMAALEGVKLLSGAMEPATLGRKLIFDLRTMSIRFQEAVRSVDCSKCSGI